jgi:hypothetical protein
METNQTIGRAWRQGQTAQVLVFDVLSPDSVDVVVSSYADSKELMMEDFLARKTLSQKLLAGLDDQADDEPTSADEDETMRSHLSSKSRTRARRLKQQQLEPVDGDKALSTKGEPEETVGLGPSESGVRKRKGPSAQGPSSKKKKLAPESEDQSVKAHGGKPETSEAIAGPTSSSVAPRPTSLTNERPAPSNIVQADSTRSSSSAGDLPNPIPKNDLTSRAGQEAETTLGEHIFLSTFTAGAWSPDLIRQNL